MNNHEQLETILSLYLSQRISELYNCETKEKKQNLNAKVQRDFNSLLKGLFGKNEK